MKLDHAAGFTLLEIMLAMLILGMVVSMVSFSLSGSINVMNATTDQGGIYYRAQVALERISEDLASAVLAEDAEFVGVQREDHGSRSALLSFPSMAHLVFDPESGRPGMGIISYAVQQDRYHEGQLLLLRADVLHRPGTDDAETTGKEEVEAFLLCDRLRSIKFTFIDRDGDEQESWDTTINEQEQNEDEERALPAAVSCRLEFWLDQDRGTSLVFKTTILLPTGLIRAESEEEGDAA